MDCAKAQRELGWTPRESFSSGLRKTVQWYLAHEEWISSVTSGTYREWIDLHYHTSQ